MVLERAGVPLPLQNFRGMYTDFDTNVVHDDERCSPRLPCDWLLVHHGLRPCLQMVNVSLVFRLNLNDRGIYKDVPVPTPTILPSPLFPCASPSLWRIPSQRDRHWHVSLP